jgi:hypothetical protein
MYKDEAMKPHNDHNPFMYFAVTWLICGALALYLASIR